MRWTRNATQVLIEERRSRQLLFTTTPIQRQYRIWRAISAEVLRRSGLRVSKNQCRNKWNALKTGYENLERLIEQNPQQFPTHTPTLDDEYFHGELSDEFWLVECNYFIIILII
jgi:DNA-binding LacI/PurR family transcriptional regulator